MNQNNPLGTTKGREKVREAIAHKYGTNIKYFASSTYFECKKLN